jgi:hypothetical protein
MPCTIKVRGRINQFWVDGGYADGIAQALGEPTILTPPSHLSPLYKRGFDAGKKAGKRQRTNTLRKAA